MLQKLEDKAGTGFESQAEKFKLGLKIWII